MQEYPIVLLLERLPESERVFQSDTTNMEFEMNFMEEKQKQPTASENPSKPACSMASSLYFTDLKTSPSTDAGLSFWLNSFHYTGKQQTVSPILSVPCYNLLAKYLTTGSNSLELTGLSVTDLGSRIFYRDQCYYSDVCLVDFSRKFPGLNIVPLYQHTRSSVFASSLDESPYGVMLNKIALSYAA